MHMGSIAFAAVAAFILICTTVVPVTAATRGSDGGAAPARTARKLLSEQDANFNPNVVAYWNQKLENLRMPEAMASLVSRLSPKDATRFQEAITSKKLLDPSQDSLAASFCSAAGLLCTNSQSSEEHVDGQGSGGPVDKQIFWRNPYYGNALPNSQSSEEHVDGQGSGGPVDKQIVWRNPYHGNALPNSQSSEEYVDGQGSGGPVDKQIFWRNPYYGNALPNSQSSKDGSGGHVDEEFFWTINPYWNAFPPPSKEHVDGQGSGGPGDKEFFWTNPYWNALSHSKPPEPYSESELALARHLYFLPENMPTAASGATLPAELFTDSPTRGSGAYLPRRLVSALRNLRWPEFLQALRTPAGSPWAATLASTFQLCEHYNGTFEAEKRTCARSLEDLADFVASQLVTNLVESVAVEVSGGVERQSQAAAAGSLEVVKVEKRSPRSRTAVVCHDMGSFAYKLLACHTIQDTEIYSVTLKSSVEPSVSFSNVVACHTDIKTFRPDHIVFRVLGIKPGQAGVCHYTHPGVTAFYHNDHQQLAMASSAPDLLTQGQQGHSGSVFSTT